MIAFENGIFLVLQVVLVVLSLWALVDLAPRPAAAFPAAGKLTKPIWGAILAVSLLVSILSGSALGLLGVVAAIASITYLVDVRPAVREVRPGGPWS